MNRPLVRLGAAFAFLILIWAFREVGVTAGGVGLAGIVIVGGFAALLAFVFGIHNLLDFLRGQMGLAPRDDTPVRTHAKLPHPDPWVRQDTGDGNYQKVKSEWAPEVPLAPAPDVTHKKRVDKNTVHVKPLPQWIEHIRSALIDSGTEVDDIDYVVEDLRTLGNPDAWPEAPHRIVFKVLYRRGASTNKIHNHFAKAWRRTNSPLMTYKSDYDELKEIRDEVRNEAQ